MAKNKKVGTCSECGGDVVKSKANGFKPVCTVCGS